MTATASVADRCSHQASLSKVTVCAGGLAKRSLTIPADAPVPKRRSVRRRFAATARCAMPLLVTCTDRDSGEVHADDGRSRACIGKWQVRSSRHCHKAGCRAVCNIVPLGSAPGSVTAAGAGRRRAAGGRCRSAHSRACPEPPAPANLKGVGGCFRQVNGLAGVRTAAWCCAMFNQPKTGRKRRATGRELPMRAEPP